MRSRCACGAWRRILARPLPKATGSPPCCTAAPRPSCSILGWRWPASGRCNPAENVLELRASAGLYTHLDGPHGRVPVGAFKIGRIAEERTPHLTNAVLDDPRVSDQAWARREGMVAFAGYPLVVDDRLIGVMAMFARTALGDATLQAMASVATALPWASTASGRRRNSARQRRRREPPTWPRASSWPT